MSQTQPEFSLLTLDMPATRIQARAGTKAAHLASLRQAGLPVPAGFVIPPEMEPSDPSVRTQITASFEEIHAGGATAVAVRSSSSAEDLPDASFAGQQETILNVQDTETLFSAIEQVRASLYSMATTAYRERVGIARATMSVLVQHQIDAVASGAAFGQDPITGEPVTIIEAVAGLGDALMAGKVTPHVWRIEKDGQIVERSDGQAVASSNSHCREAHRGKRPQDYSTNRPHDHLTLPETVLRKVANLVEQAESAFGSPQDIEWVWDGEQVWVLQARPISVRRDGDFFTDHYENDTWLWTATFLNERFTQPISPLGWSIVAGPLEALALRTPLELLGAENVEGPLLKLWRGHPYSRGVVWQRIYKLFPDSILPEDASNYFPAGDVSLRSAPREPHLGLHLIWNGLRVLLSERGGASPFHNPSAWRAFEEKLDARLDRLTAEERSLQHLPDEIALQTSRRLLRDAQTLTEDLLSLHRWSLLYADLTYSLLRRLCRARYGSTAGAHRAAELTANVQSKTAQLNDALDRLAEMVSRRPDLRNTLAHASSVDEVEAAREPDDEFVTALYNFMQYYGHRFFSLDLADPPYEAAPDRLFTLLRTRAGDTDPSLLKQAGTAHPLMRPFVQQARQYIRLREDQRFAWQRILAFQRRVAMDLGTRWANENVLTEPQHVFGLTWQELIGRDVTPALGNIAAQRYARWRRLREQFALAPGWHYPDFLRGNHPLIAETASDTLHGRPVSPGIARGRVRVITSPDEFDRLQKGDILVTLAPDPGWTPIFGTIAGLVSERGGQLSHAAVVAREYGLPAVAGISGALTSLDNDVEVLVDGTEGIVRKLS